MKISTPDDKFAQIFFGTALVITSDAPLIACWAGALYYLYHAVIEHRRCSWIGVGILFGLGLLISVALFSPVILWNLRQDWASFSFQSIERLSADFDFALPELLGSALLLLTPAGSPFIGRFGGQTKSCGVY